MMCLTPVIIRNPKKARLPQDPLYLTVPCGKCYACLYNKRQEWVFRINVEASRSDSSFFVTLTYAEESLPQTERGVPTLCGSDLLGFIKRLRKENPSCNIRYFAVGEYGSESRRPHFHICLFNLVRKWPEQNRPSWWHCADYLAKLWPDGQVQVSFLNGARQAYCTKYCNKFDDKLIDDLGCDKSRIWCSRRPAIGLGILPTIDFNSLRARQRITYHGESSRVPRVYKKYLPESVQAYLRLRGREATADFEALKADSTKFSRKLRDQQLRLERAKKRQNKII